jgi:[CysO sulfur-carrier protein]-S-L-cysteine hydrolase
VRLTRNQWQQLVAHAERDAPNECCGYLRARDGTVDEVTEAANARNSPYGYELPAPALLAVNDLDDDGWEIGVYHSHPRSSAEPSQTDINLATYPHWTYLIVSLAEPGTPEIRAWRMADGRVEEEPVEVD